ncbi:hypothetical protein C2G38_2196713 [Gigaspora rosea]|uniref:Uncharacterized protein n=1 Tax=Gigaspora rosea TaxID=44941 RepID=A0A397UWX9_9GLOM|nr:hypothetical protein C2G38_2196713 [Gigaspora rosea]
MRCRTHIWAAKGKPDEAFITVTFPSGQSSDDRDLLGGYIRIQALAEISKGNPQEIHQKNAEGPDGNSQENLLKKNATIPEGYPQENFPSKNTEIPERYSQEIHQITAEVLEKNPQKNASKKMLKKKKPLKYQRKAHKKIVGELSCEHSSGSKKC